ncbi:MAG: hypothetical protein AAFY72_15660, partial [Cyanobacteria bacterium J06649_4]
AMARKGSRKITVAGIDYRWRVNRPRRISDWRMERERLDEKFCAIAEQYGLREVADVVFRDPFLAIAIEQTNLNETYINGIYLSG